MTGGTGNVGTQLTKQLAATGAEIRVAVRNTTKTDDLKTIRAEPVEVDLNRPETLRPAFEGVGKLFLLTPVVPQTAEISASLVEEARKAGVRHIIKLSGLGADSETPITLARWHREAEKIIEDSGIAYTFLRPNSFMQNYINFATIKEHGAFYLPLGDGKTSFVDTRDIAAAAVAALIQSGHEGKAYDITGPEALDNYRIAEILSSVTGKKISYVDISEDDARKAMTDLGMPESVVTPLIELYALQKAGHGSAVSPAVEQITGKKPIEFEQFARDYVEAFK